MEFGTRLLKKKHINITQSHAVHSLYSYIFGSVEIFFLSKKQCTPST